MEPVLLVCRIVRLERGHGTSRELVGEAWRSHGWVRLPENAVVVGLHSEKIKKRVCDFFSLPIHRVYYSHCLVTDCICFRLCLDLYRKANHTRRYPRAGIARGETEFVSTSSAIILTGINDNRTPNDTVRANEIQNLVLDGHGALSIFGHNDIAEGAHLALLICRGPMVLA